MIEKLISVFQSSVTDDAERNLLMFKLLNFVLFVVSAFMTGVNIVTGEYLVMASTLVFAVLCLLNYVLIRRIRREWVYALFAVESAVVLGFYIVTGQPEGFSALWILIVPSFTLSIFGMKVGGLMSAAAFAMLIFFFWVPFGRGMLQYAYTQTFMLRFPFVYVCLFLIALYIEGIRVETLRGLRRSEESYRALYRHDALTKLYNRHAFYEEMEHVFSAPSNEHVAVLMFDIDDFKQINDEYGHNAGDAVLCSLAQIIRENICEHCTACRWGGEEFLVLMQCRHNPYEIAETIRKKVEAHSVTSEGRVIRFTISGGVCVAYSIEKSQIGQFINQADKALYISKTSGKNRTTQIAVQADIAG